MIKEDIFLLFYECPITLFSLLMKCSFLIELGNTLCCLNILPNSQSHFSAESCQIEILKILCRLLTLNWISLFELWNGIGCQPRACARRVCFRTWVAASQSHSRWVGGCIEKGALVCVCRCSALLLRSVGGQAGKYVFQPLGLLSF